MLQKYSLIITLVGKNRSLCAMGPFDSLIENSPVEYTEEVVL